MKTRFSHYFIIYWNLINARSFFKYIQYILNKIICDWGREKISMSESANCNTNEKNEDRIWEMRVFECTSFNSRRSGQGRQHREGNMRSRFKRRKEGIMLGQELPAEGRQVLRSSKCKYTGRLEKHQMINMTTGDSTKGSIKEIKIFLRLILCLLLHLLLFSPNLRAVFSPCL